METDSSDPIRVSAEHVPIQLVAAGRPLFEGTPNATIDVHRSGTIRVTLQDARVEPDGCLLNLARIGGRIGAESMPKLPADLRIPTPMEDENE